MTRVLVIDDQNDVRAMICMVLQVNRFDVVEAASAAAGVKAFANGRFDVAIVDILLEDAMGYDVIAALRERVPDLPVSGLMSLDGDGEAVECGLPAQAVPAQRTDPCDCFGQGSDAERAPCEHGRA